MRGVTGTDRRPVAVACALVSVLARASVSSAQTNYQSYPIGGRATGMGGAATALAEDTAGAFYNPAGTAFAEGDSLSLSTSLYGVLGGQTVGAYGAGTSFSYASVNIVPSATSSLMHVGRHDAAHPSPWVFGFNVFAPQSARSEQRTTLHDGDTTVSVTSDESTLLVGPSLAYRINDRLAVGVAVYGAYHSASTDLDLTDTSGASQGASYIQRTANLTQSDLGAVFSLGARWEPLRGFTVGLSVRTPTVPILGSGTAFTRAVLIPAAGAGTMSVLAASDLEVETRSVMPARIALGVAWARRGRFAVAADVALYLPVTYTAFRSTADPSLDQDVVHHAVVNCAVGVEYYLRPSIPLRAGFFTDLSPADVPTAAQGGEDHVSLAGGTLGVSFVSRHTSSQLGVVGAVGSATVAGVDLQRGTYDPRVSSVSQYRVFLVYSGAYSF